MVADWSDSMERGRLYANPSGMGCALANPSGALIDAKSKGIHSTETINTDIPKDRRHLNHFLLTSRTIHETGSAINVRSNSMATIVSKTVGTVKKSKHNVIISKANRTGNAHQYLMMILFIYSVYIEIELQIRTTESHTNSSQKADDYSMIWEYKIRYYGKNYNQ